MAKLITALFLILLTQAFAYASPANDFEATRESQIGIESLTEVSKPLARVIDSNTEAHLSRIRLIQNAKKTIQISSIILKDDEYTRILLREIVEAANRGVNVWILLDSIGVHWSRSNLSLIHHHPKIEIRFFRDLSTWNGLKKINHRMHDKIFLVDNETLITGGRNYSALYFDELEFFDIDVEIRQSPAIKAAKDYFFSVWKNKDSTIPRAGLFGIANDSDLEIFQKCYDRGDYLNCLLENQEPLRQSFLKFCEDSRGITLRECQNRSLIRRSKFRKEISDLSLSMSPELQRQIVESQSELESQFIEVDKIIWMDSESKNDFSENQVSSNIVKSHLSLFENAKQRILVSNAYVVPTPELVAALSKSPAHKMIITNSAGTSDVAPTVVGNCQTMGQLDQIGVETYYIYDIPGTTMVHPKVAAIDSEISIVGSYNLDPRSQNLNTETGVVILGEEFQLRLVSSIYFLMEHSRMVSAKTCKEGYEVKGFFHSGYISFSRLMLTMFPAIRKLL